MKPSETRELVREAKHRDATYLGTRTSLLGVEEHIKVNDEDRMTHVLNAGPTGYGKTQELLHVALQDAYKGGLCIINPKGGLLDEFLAKLPENRWEDVTYIDPSRESVPSINVLEPYTNGQMNLAQKENQKEIIVSDLIDLFRRQSENWGDRFGRILETLLHAHIDLNIRNNASHSLVDVYRCVIDTDALNELIDLTVDPVVREQLIKVKEEMGSHELEPLQRRLNDFMMNSAIRRVIQGEQDIDFREAIDNQEIILVDVQKGEVGSTVSELVGSIVITKVWAAAQSRVTQPEERQTPFYLFVDELQNYSGEGSNFAKILSEAREYRLGLWLSTQYLHQLDAEMRRAVSNNTNTKMFFNPSGSEDANRIAGMLQGIDKAELTELGKFRAAIQVPSKRSRSQADIIDTYPPYIADLSMEEVEELKKEFTGSGEKQEVEIVNSTGESAASGGETHEQLLKDAKRFLEFEKNVQVNLLRQDGSEKPDGHIIGEDQVAHLEAEHTTVSKPEKVLKNLERAREQDRECVFIVEDGNRGRLENNLEDVDTGQYRILVSTDLGVIQ